MPENKEIIFDRFEKNHTTDHVVTIFGRSFYATRLPTALKAAQGFAGNSGVLSLPELVHGRIVAPVEHPMHRMWYSALSEELSGKTKQGAGVVVVVHGGGIFGTPERIEQAYNDRLTNVGAGKVSDDEFFGVLEGKLSDGTTVPVYDFADFKRGIANLPRRYGVVMDFNRVKNTKSGYQKADKLKDNTLVIARTGGVEQAAAWVDKSIAVYKKKELGNWHHFAKTDIDLRQGRVLDLCYYVNYRLYGGDNLGSSGRFVAVTSEALAAAHQLRAAQTLDDAVQTAHQ